MSLLGSIAKIALPAVGSLIPGLGPVASGLLGMAGQGAADHLTNKSSAKSVENNFAQDKQLQDEYNVWSAQQASKQMDFQREERTQAQDFTQASADKSMAFSGDQAQKQMDFQAEMSNTAHQREIKDLEAAGLNPILSAKYGGSSTPSGASGTGTHASSSGQSGAQPGHAQSPAQTKASAVAARHALLQEKSLQADIDLKRAQAQSTRAQAGHSTAQTTELTYHQTERIDQAISNVMAQTGHGNQQAIESKFRTQVLREVTLPSGKIDISKAKLVLEELNMKIGILRTDEGKKYIHQELGQRGGTFGGAVPSTVHAISRTADYLNRLIDGSGLTTPPDPTKYKGGQLNDSNYYDWQKNH